MLAPSINVYRIMNGTLITSSFLVQENIKSEHGILFFHVEPGFVFSKFKTIRQFQNFRNSLIFSLFQWVSPMRPNLYIVA